MAFDEDIERFGLTISEAQYRAAAYLEREGKVFLVDFGYENAVAVAQAHWRKRRPFLRRITNPFERFRP